MELESGSEGEWVGERVCRRCCLGVGSLRRALDQRSGDWVDFIDVGGSGVGGGGDIGAGLSWSLGDDWGGVGLIMLVVGEVGVGVVLGGCVWGVFGRDVSGGDVTGGRVSGEDVSGGGVDVVALADEDKWAAF